MKPLSSPQAPVLYVSEHRRVRHVACGGLDALPAATGRGLQLSDPNKVLVIIGDEESQLLLKLCLEVKRQEESASDKTAEVVFDGCAGDLYPLHVYTGPAGT
jgi:hypothetical protein